MALDSISKLASNLAETANDTEVLKQNISPDDEGAQLQVQFRETVVADGTLGLTAIKHTYDSTAFVLDHITLGNLDSSVLELDGGYAALEAEFPLTFPILFGEGEILFNINV